METVIEPRKNTMSKHFLVNTLSAILLVGLTVTGLAMKFSYHPPAGAMSPGMHDAERGGGPPEGRGPMGFGPGRGGPGMTWMGLSKHTCEEVHFWLSVLLIPIIIYHAVLHRRWIWNAARGHDPQTQGLRGAVLLACVVLFICLICLPFIVPAT